jgi:hypothetical protein
MTETVSRSASADFSRFWKPRGTVFVLGVILPNRSLAGRRAPPRR